MSLDAETWWASKPITGLDVPIAVTFFADAGAGAKEEQTGTLRELAAIVRDVRASSKGALPWLKLASFGARRTERNSLRHDANVLSISGVEGDYDGALITMERARQIVSQAGIAALLYTSPSHTPGAPKWRILCPASQGLPPSERGRLLARVNGLFVGALAHESFTLSQAYYYGAVSPGEHHEVIEVDGRPIDLADELDAGAIYSKAPKPAPAPTATAPVRLGDGEASPYGRAALERECANITSAADGGKHYALNKAAYSIGGLVAAGEIAEGYAADSLRNALEAIRSRCDDFAHAEQTLAGSLQDGIRAPRKAPEPRPETITPGIFKGFSAAELKSPPPGGPAYDPETGEILPESPAPSPAKGLMTIAEIEAMPPQAWLIDGLLPERGLIVPYGPPKVGKTFVVLSMALHIAAGMDWFGRAVRQGVVVYIAGEGLGGLAARIKAMRSRYSIAADVPFYVRPKAVNFRDPNAVKEIVALAKDAADGRPIALVVIDTLARAMPGVDENSAQEVGVVIAHCDWVRDELACAVAPIHHTGKDQERGMRGSNAIHGAVDTTLRLKAASKGRVTMINEDQKDGEPAPPMTFTMEEVSTGLRSSLVPILEDARPPGRPKVESADAEELLTRIVLAMAGCAEAPFARLVEAVMGQSDGRTRKLISDLIPASEQDAATVKMGTKRVRLWRRIAGEHRTSPIYVMQSQEDYAGE